MLPPPIRIVGCGSANGDDRVGAMTIDALRRRDVGGASLHLARGGDELLDLLDGHGTLILIDAMVSGAAAGVVHELTWPHPRLQQLRPGSTHDLNPAAALLLAEALGVLPPRVIILAVEAAQFTPAAPPSEAVADGITRLQQRVHELIASRIAPSPVSTSANRGG